MHKQIEIETELIKIYREMGEFFSKISRKDYGFKILNSPPLYQPSILFIGFQPGGNETDFKYEVGRESHLTWPKKIGRAHV